MSDVLQGEREKRREDCGDGHYTMRYLVRGESGTIGSYAVFYRPDGTPYGASRDCHAVAGPGALEAHEAWVAWIKDDDAPDPGPDYAPSVCHCQYLGCDAICDGSSLVEIVTDDESAWKIAELMAR